MGAVPVPDSAMVCGLPAALSVRVSAATRLPAADGVKVTSTLVLLPGVTVIGSVPAVKEKSAAFPPAMARLAITRFAVPVLDTVTSIKEPATPTA